jgi:hypothetical protein
MNEKRRQSEVFMILGAAYARFYELGFVQDPTAATARSHGAISVCGPE